MWEGTSEVYTNTQRQCSIIQHRGKAGAGWSVLPTGADAVFLGWVTVPEVLSCIFIVETICPISNF